ncbi:MAG: hypothetical protein JNK05_08130 [Myxococcales bacterium]|nr:hypothetical protein [Myxococcales bacterium]
MNTETVDVELYRRARRAYELGRLRSASLFAVALSALVAVAAYFAVGAQALPWAAWTLIVWVVVGWRGGALLQGARRGLYAGAATFLLPLSILRPCCKPGVVMTSDCCTRPELCIVAGGAIGLGLALFLPRSKSASRWETAGGMVLGVLSVAVLKCAKLFAGEALGLLGGLAVGVLVVSSVGALREARAAA